MAKKKLTATQVSKLQKTINASTRKLMIDRIDFGTESNVKSTVNKLIDLLKISIGIIRK